VAAAPEADLETLARALVLLLESYYRRHAEEEQVGRPRHPMADCPILDERESAPGGGRSGGPDDLVGPRASATS
jgi:hypothetical protein